MWFNVSLVIFISSFLNFFSTVGQRNIAAIVTKVQDIDKGKYDYAAFISDKKNDSNAFHVPFL